MYACVSLSRTRFATSIVTYLEHSSVERARAADLRRLIGVQLRAELMISLVIPDAVDALLGHVAKVYSIRRRNHAAGHSISAIAKVGPSPRPIAALAPRRASGM